MAARQYTRRLLTGMLTYLPLVARLSERTTGGSDSAAYCYRIWLRHLMLADRACLPKHPRVVAEIGPGDSLGTGIMALLTGATTYVAVDLVEYASSRKNIEMVDELRRLLVERTPVQLPGESDDSLSFPSQILSDQRLEAALSPTRMRAVRAAVAQLGREHDGIRMAYAVGDVGTRGISATADVVFSSVITMSARSIEAPESAHELCAERESERRSCGLTANAIAS